MKRKEIQFVIDRKGNVKTTVKGVQGAGCASLLEPFLELGRVTDEQRTADYYAACETQVLLHGSTERE